MRKLISKTTHRAPRKGRHAAAPSLNRGQTTFSGKQDIVDRWSRCDVGSPVLPRSIRAVRAFPPAKPGEKVVCPGLSAQAVKQGEVRSVAEHLAEAPGGHDPGPPVPAQSEQPGLVAGHQVIGARRFGEREQEIVVRVA